MRGRAADQLAQVFRRATRQVPRERCSGSSGERSASRGSVTEGVAERGHESGQTNHARGACDRLRHRRSFRPSGFASPSIRPMPTPASSSSASTRTAGPSARSARMRATSRPPNSRPCWATPTRAPASPPSSTSWRRCAGSASTTPSSRSTAPEAPIMDGSAAAFVAAIDQAGIVALAAPRRFTKVLKPIRVQKGDAYGELRPYDRGFRVDVEIDFAHPLIGQQSIALDVEPTTFRREVARARTFGFMKDVSKLWGAGYALGASLENTLVRRRRPPAQSGRAALRRRVRAPQGARRDRRPGAGRRAAARRLQVGQGRPPAQSRGAVRADRRSDRLDGGRGEVRGPGPAPRGHADVAAGLVAPAYRADLS